MTDYENMSKEELIFEIKCWKNKCKILQKLLSSMVNGVYDLFRVTSEKVIEVDWEMFKDDKE